MRRRKTASGGDDTCRHLAPVANAMRDAGITLEPRGGLVTEAACMIDRAAFGRVFDLPPSVGYREFETWERSLHDPPGASVWCSRCNSSIRVVHPRLAGQDTPVFPK